MGRRGEMNNIISFCRRSFIHIMLFVGEGVTRSLRKSEGHLLYILWFSRFFSCWYVPGGRNSRQLGYFLDDISVGRWENSWEPPLWSWGDRRTVGREERVWESKAEDLQACGSPLAQSPQYFEYFSNHHYSRPFPVLTVCPLIS